MKTIARTGTVRSPAPRVSDSPATGIRLNTHHSTVFWWSSLAGRFLLRYRDFRHARKFSYLGLRRHAVTYEGQRFVYYSADRVDDRPTLVLLHGFLDRGFAFRHVIAPLIRDYRVIVVDLPGHGDCSLPALREAWTGPALYRSLYRFLRNLCNEPVHLLTHSMGGLLALQMHLYARRLNEMPFLSLCAIAPGALLLPEAELDDLRRRFFPQSTAEVRSLLAELHHGLAERADEIPEFVLQGLLYRWSTPGFRYLAENTMERPDEVFLTEKQLRQCHLPVTLIWGAEDRIVPLARGRQMAKALQAQLHIVPGVGHNMLSESPDAVVREAITHLRQFYHQSVRRARR